MNPTARDFTPSKPRQASQEGEGSGSPRAQEQVPENGRRHLWRGGKGSESIEVQGWGEENNGILENKNRQLYRVLFFNARSIVSKIDLLQTELYARSSKPDIICICETFCNDQHSDAYLALTGYEIVSRRDGRDTIKGITRGLLIYSKQGLQASELKIKGSESVTECTGITLLCCARPFLAPRAFRWRVC